MSISVVVPVHNGAQTLGRCLEALRCSSYINFECIVVDDGSTDSSYGIAEKFAPRLVRGVGTPKGAAHARNRGVEVASGEILLFVDADVAVQPDTLDKVAKLFASSPSIDAAFGGYDDHPAVSSFVSQYKNLFHHYVHQHAREDAGTFWTGCGAVRTSVFQAIGGFDERYSSIEDIELGYRLREAGHRIYLDKSMQVTHLKHWTLRGMIKSDLLDRGIPWTRLMLRNRALANDLNLRISQRVSAALACVMALYGALSPFYFGIAGRRLITRLLLPISICTSLIILLNHRLYVFFLRKRGIRFMLAAVPIHLLYYGYSVLAFAVGVGLHVREQYEKPSSER